MAVSIALTGLWVSMYERAVKVDSLSTFNSDISRK